MPSRIRAIPSAACPVIDAAKPLAAVAMPTTDVLPNRSAICADIALVASASAHDP